MILNPILFIRDPSNNINSITCINSIALVAIDWPSCIGSWADGGRYTYKYYIVPYGLTYALTI